MPQKAESAGIFKSVDDLAEYLGVSRKKAYDGLNAGEIPAIRLGRRFIIPRSAIETWLSTAGNRAA